MRFSKLLCSLMCSLMAAAAAFAADSGIWKVAPPPPASWQRDRVADLAARRKAMMEQIGEHAVLVLYAAEPRNYANDVDWPYRQENDFFYLTGLTQPGATLVLAPGAGKMREMVFIPRPVPAQETWTGHMITAAEARETSGIQEIFEAGQFNGFFGTLIARSRPTLTTTEGAGAGAGRGRRGGESAATAPASTPDWASEFSRPIADAGRQELQLYMILPAIPNAVEYRREQEFAGKLAAVGAGVNIKDATTLFANLRRVKSPREIEILQHAVDITAEAFQRAYAVAAPGTAEYEIQAQFEFTFLRRNGHWGYPCIVGLRQQRDHAALRIQQGHDEGRRSSADGRRGRIRPVQRGCHAHDPGERQVQQGAGRHLPAGVGGAAGGVRDGRSPGTP